MCETVITIEYLHICKHGIKAIVVLRHTVSFLFFVTSLEIKKESAF